MSPQSRVVSVVLPADTTLNSNRRADSAPYRRAPRTDAIRSAFRHAAHGMHPLTTPVNVELQLEFGRNARRDAPNWWPTAKAAIDGLVDAALIADDSDKHVTRTVFPAHTTDPALRATKTTGARVRLTITITEDH